MSKIDRFLDGVKTVAISGHINPDGDSLGACLAAMTYINDNYPGIVTDVYLHEPQDVFGFLKGVGDIKTSVDKNKKYDLLILLDISSIDRVMDGGTLMENSTHSLCIDHHKTNEGGYDWFFNEPDISSACELLYKMLDRGRISFDCAQALYTGIVHDTGVFRFSCTSPDTMRTAADLMSFGLPFTDIIEESYYKKSYAQNLMMGQVIAGSEMLFGGKMVWGSVNARERHRLGLAAKELDGIVNQLGNVRNVELSAFVYELDGGNEFKVSLRSAKYVDVSAVCKSFGGGGHERAAGCTLKGTFDEIKARLIAEIEKTFKSQGLL